MITAVGNCPSSGSTLLADLLDSTPFTACGNELSLLAQRSLYDFATYRTRIRLFRKYLFDLRSGEGRPRPFAYRHAVVRVG